MSTGSQGSPTIRLAYLSDLASDLRHVTSLRHQWSASHGFVGDANELGDRIRNPRVNQSRIFVPVHLAIYLETYGSRMLAPVFRAWEPVTYDPDIAAVLCWLSCRCVRVAFHVVHPVT